MKKILTFLLLWIAFLGFSQNTPQVFSRPVKFTAVFELSSLDSIYGIDGEGVMRWVKKSDLLSSISRDFIARSGTEPLKLITGTLEADWNSLQGLDILNISQNISGTRESVAGLRLSDGDGLETLSLYNNYGKLELNGTQIKANGKNVITSINGNEANAAGEISVSGNFRTSINLSSPAPDPSDVGYFLPTEDGIYTFYGGLEIDLAEGFNVISFDGVNFSKQVVPIDLNDYYNKSASKDNYLDILNLDVDGIVSRPTYIRPYNKVAETFTTGTNLGTSAAYYEVNNKVVKSNNEVLKKVHVYSTGAGTINLLFGRITGGLGFIDYTLPKTVVAGWNVFTFSEGDIPAYITDLSEYIVCANNVTTGLMKYKATPAGTLSVFGVNASGGSITATTNTLGMYIEVQEMNQTILERFPQLESDFNDLTELTGTVGLEKVPNNVQAYANYTNVSSYLYSWCNEKSFITNEDEISELVVSTTTGGGYTIEIIEVEGSDYNVVHSYSGTAIIGTNRISAATMGLPDLSSYDRLYIALKNNSSSTGISPIRSRNNAVQSYYYRFNPATFKAERFLNTLEWNFYVNVVAPVYNRASAEILSSRIATQGVSNYNELIDALTSSDIVKIADGDFIATETILLPPGKKLWGTKKAIIKPGAGVTNAIYITGNGQSLQGFKIDMGGGTMDFYGSTQISTAEQLETLVNIGTLTGIYVYEGENINIDNVTVVNANAFGLLLEKTGDVGGALTTPRFTEGTNVTNFTARNCYIGIRGGSGAQYSRITNSNAIQCIAGISLTYGNMAVSNSHFTQCRVGAHVGAGGNDGHGTFTGCFFNHNTLNGSYCTNLLYGMSFSNCQWFEGIIGIKNSLGVVLNGGIIASAITADLSASQLGMIKNVMFRTNGVSGSGTVTKTGTGVLVMSGNEFWNAGSNATINGTF